MQKTSGPVNAHMIHRIIEPRLEKNNVLFLTWSDTNQAVQQQKMAMGLKFWIQKVGGLYYLCSEDKGKCKTLVFS